MTDRRDFLKTAVYGAGALSAALLGGGAFRPALAQTPLARTKLSDRVALIGGAGGNVVVLDGPDGLALVDSGAPKHAAALVAFLADELGGKPVSALFNTHWHLESTGGNEAFATAGARIYAHINTKLWMSTEFYVDWQDRTYPPRPDAALPTETFYSHEPQPLETSIGDRIVEYAHLPEAHTDGDIYVRFPEDNVIVAGGVAAKGAYPILDTATGGWIGGMADAVKTLIDLCDGETRIVPETGPVLTRADLEAEHEMLVTLQGRIEDAMKMGKSAREMIEEGVTKDFDAQWGNGSKQFVSNAYDGLWWGGRVSGVI
ncbi:MAG TPA: MBL fold metallo-hydrolase [Gammaproteobacteria bacterium]